MSAWGRFARAAAPALGLSLAAHPAPSADAVDVPWDSAFPVAELALDSVGLASALIDEAARARGLHPAPAALDPLRVVASFGSERMLRVDGAVPPVWAPLSGFFPVADGWVRTHANYPHHAERLRGLLGVAADAAPDEVAAALASWRRTDLENATAAAAAVVAAVRDAAEWAQHPQASVLAAGPLVAAAATGPAEPRPWRGESSLPLAGVRVLDLTRVIAGPVATRDLALAGADVLRIDDPQRPEIGWQHLDTGQHKRSALLDLSRAGERGVFAELLDSADVVVTGYRPGALDRFGLDPDTLASAYPGLVVGTVSAWGEVGPWAHRRGFDSIVQATIGIARAEQEHRGDVRPGALPVQALDHASGHLLAAAVVGGLVRQRVEGGSHHVSVALARTGMELLKHRDTEPPGAAPGPWPSTTPVSLRLEDGTDLACAPPPLAFSGAPAQYAWVHRWGTDAAQWLPEESRSDSR
jgi:crotonobetainyl-CoA:carnitine CoA-transferase CaiB-like acyl-CoA transferase